MIKLILATIILSAIGLGTAHALQVKMGTPYTPSKLQVKTGGTLSDPNNYNPQQAAKVDLQPAANGATFDAVERGDVELQ